MKRIWKLLLPAAAAALLLGLFCGCGSAKTTEYRIEASGTAEGSGVVCFLDYTINVYADQAGDPCGECPDQPVHLFAGATAEETAQAISDTVTRADDQWDVESVSGSTVVLKAREGQDISDAGSLSAPAGLSLKGTFTHNGTSVTISSTGTAASAASSSATVSDPQRLAAVYGPSYEMLVVLGAEDRIVVRADVQTDSFPWAEVVFRRIDEIPYLDNVHTSVNFEELMTYAPDLVFAFPRQDELTQMQSAGVAAVPGQTSSTLSGTCDQLMTYAEALGGDAEANAQAYCAYFNEKLQYVKDTVAAVPADQRPTVYYAGVDVLTTYGSQSDLVEAIEAAGGTAVSAGLNAGNRVQIDYEQLIAWSPEYIFLDHGGMNDGETIEQLKTELTTQSQYASLPAVQNGRIFTVPSGVFYWDMGLQKILLVEYMAKTLYPDLFQDLDMTAELTDFYSRFYHYDLTPEQAAKILAREAP